MAKKSSKKIRVAINGFGRIGRAFLKVAVEHPEIDVVAVNELGDIRNMAYLFKYDSVYGVSNLDISVDVPEICSPVSSCSIVFNL